MKGSATRLERTSTKFGIESGITLCELKDRLPHGQFLCYCNQELDTGERQGQLWMRLARLAESVGRDRLELVPITVVHKIAAKGVPDPLIHEIITDFEGGKVLTVEIVLTRINDAKKSSSPRPDTTDPKQIDEIHAMLIRELGSEDIAQLVGFLSGARAKTIRELTGRLGSSLVTPKPPRMVSLPAVFG